MALLFGFGKLIYVIILLINAVAVLSEDRFLARIGWGRSQVDPGFGARESSVQARTGELIASIRTVMRIPLIAINTVIILYELILG